MKIVSSALVLTLVLFNGAGALASSDSDEDLRNKNQSKAIQQPEIKEDDDMSLEGSEEGQPKAIQQHESDDSLKALQLQIEETDKKLMALEKKQKQDEKKRQLMEVLKQKQDELARLEKELDSKNEESEASQPSTQPQQQGGFNKKGTRYEWRDDKSNNVNVRNEVAAFTNRQVKSVEKFFEKKKNKK